MAVKITSVKLEQTWDLAGGACPGRQSVELVFNDLLKAQIVLHMSTSVEKDIMQEIHRELASILNNHVARNGR